MQRPLVKLKAGDEGGDQCREWGEGVGALKRIYRWRGDRLRGGGRHDGRAKNGWRHGESATFSDGAEAPKPSSQFTCAYAQE